MSCSFIITHFSQTGELRSLLGAFDKLRLRPHQVIVVDDGSVLQYRARELAAAHGADFIGLPKNVGVPRAMLAGLEAATGEWVHFAACGDVPKVTLPRDIYPDVDVDLVVYEARWIDDESGIWWESGEDELVSHVAFIRRGKVELDPELGCHCDWWMLRRIPRGRTVFVWAPVKDIHLRRGQYSDVDRWSADYRRILHRIIEKMEALPDARRRDARRECWLADFGLAGLLALRTHKFRRLFWSWALVGRALWREAEIQGRRHLPRWAKRLAAKHILGGGVLSTGGSRGR